MPTPALNKALPLLFLVPSLAIAQDQVLSDCPAPARQPAQSVIEVKNAGEGIHGQVVSALLGEPVAGAQVSIPSLGRVAFSDSTGGFDLGLLPVQGRHRLNVRAIGRQPAHTFLDTVAARRGVKVLATLQGSGAIDLACVSVLVTNGVERRTFFIPVKILPDHSLRLRPIKPASVVP